VLGGLLGLLRGSAADTTAEIRARGGVLLVSGAIQLSDDDHGSGGKILRLASPALMIVDVESTDEAATETLEEIAAVHPWLADLLMAGGTDELRCTPIRLDEGSSVTLSARANTPAALRVRASGHVMGRDEHPATLRFSGSWVQRVLRTLLAEAELCDGGGGTALEAACEKVASAHSALRWNLESGVATFERADMHLKLQGGSDITLAAWGSVDLVSRQVDAHIGVTAPTLRRLLRSGVTDEEQAAARALVAEDEGLVVHCSTVVPLAAPRGYYLSGGRRTREMQGVGWVGAIRWGSLIEQMAILSARKAQQKLTSVLARDGGGGGGGWGAMASVVARHVLSSAGQTKLKLETLPPPPPRAMQPPFSMSLAERAVQK
jgi:hypothetical protein